MVHDPILALEEPTWRALMHSGADFLPFLSGDCSMLFPLGMKITSKSKPSLKDVMMSDAFVPWRRYKMSEVAVTTRGPEAAQISYRVRATRQHITGEGETRQDEFECLEDRSRGWEVLDVFPPTNTL